MVSGLQAQARPEAKHKHITVTYSPPNSLRVSEGLLSTPLLNGVDRSSSHITPKIAHSS